MITDKDIDKIEQYLSLSMTMNEKRLFETELSTREDLFEAMLIQKRFNQEILKRYEERKQKGLENILARTTKHQIINEPKVVEFKPVAKTPYFGEKKSVYFGIAASFAGLLLVGFYFLIISDRKNPEMVLSDNSPIDTVFSKKNGNSNKPLEPEIKESNDNSKQLAYTKNEQLFRDNFEDIPNIYGDIPSELNESIEAYNKNNDQEALEKLPSEPKLMDDTDEAKELYQNKKDYFYLYKGVISLKLKDYVTSQAYLLEATNTTNDGVKFQAEWYLSLAYIRNNNLAEAKNILQAIRNNPDSDYSQKASLLLKKLK